MPGPNHALRAARERLSSPSSPGTPMTRQECAEAVNALVLQLTGRRTGVGANHVGTWERGVIRWPAAHYRRALRRLFGATEDAQLGFVQPGSAGTRVGRDRSARPGLGEVLGHGSARAAPDDLLASLAAPTEHYRRMESHVPSQHLAPAVEGHLRMVRAVASHQLGDGAGFAALSELAGLAAWIAADRGDSALARARYRESIRCAEVAGNPLLVAYMMGSLGYFAVETGDLRQAVRMLDHAGSRLDGCAPAAARAWLASLRAVASASLQDRQGATEELTTARRFADREPNEVQWPWVFAFTSAKAARYEASVLAQLGDVRAARMAQLLAGAGRVDEAARLGAGALEVGREYGSERIIQRVTALHAALPRGADRRDLGERLDMMYGGGFS